MCGFTGFYLNGVSEPKSSLETIITMMANTLNHRGPDDSGIWVDANKKIAFGHRRLSIVDISASGHQPMYADDKNVVIVFNGEIYNHAQLRKELNLINPDLNWNGHGDKNTQPTLVDGAKQPLDKIVGNGSKVVGL